MAPLSSRRSRTHPAVPGGRILGVALLALFLFARFGDAFRMPFLNDDYVFLDHVAGKGFASLWGFRDLAFHWWRPWSREFHYWWLQRAFGPAEAPFHLMSLLLSCGVLTAFWALARRLAGAPAAAIAVAGAVTLPGWGLLMLWAAGAQDLWMLLLSLLALLAWRADRIAFAAVLYALALASKETAAPLALLFLAHDRWVARKAWPDTIVRMVPAMLVGLVWAFAHPMVLGRLFAHAPLSTEPSPAAISPWAAVAKSALSAFSLDVIPTPDGGWKTIWWDALRGALLVLCFIELLARPDARPSDMLGGTRAARLRGVMPFGLAWWACGTLPLLLPGLGWHAYYAHFAALGLWLMVGRMLARQTGVAIALVGVLAFVGAGRAATESQDWGETAYQRRAGRFVSEIKDKLLGAYPKMERHARLWFVRLPNNVGFLAGDGPVVRVWYRDRTLQAGYYSAYRAREAGQPEGPDHFFRMDEAGRFREVKRDGSGDVVPLPPGVAATAASADTSNSGQDPRWERDRVSLAHALAAGKDWRGAAAEYRRLAIAFPDSSGYALDAASSFMQAGDSSAGVQWLREAARRPGAPAEVVSAVRAMDRGKKTVKPARKRQNDGTLAPATPAPRKARKPRGKSSGTPGL
ncbi:MAG: hypothetical protein ABL977_06320 [Candidatus Eisenbacteria bacterium]